MRNKEEEQTLLISRGDVGKRREEFFEWLGGRISKVGRRTFERVFDGTMLLGGCEFSCSRSEEGNEVDETKIYINRDDFDIDGEKYYDLIPIIVRHELEEVWAKVKIGWTAAGSRDKLLAHKIALRKEWQYAMETGKAERYMFFLRRFADKALVHGFREHFIGENEEAYRVAQRRSLHRQNTR